MIFNTGAALLDAIVLSAVDQAGSEGAYGYKITQDVREVLDVSESTLYPVLRRLYKDECLEIHDKQIDGRNRRYYQLTPQGSSQLELYKAEWAVYTDKINQMLRR